jgi:hypothetical protein
MPSSSQSVRARAAILTLTCDLPAARRVAGFGGHAARFVCAHCRLELDAARDLNYAKWRRLTCAEIREKALAWRDDTTYTSQNAQWDLTLIRWTPLYHLSYWDPTRMLNIDTMHHLKGVLEFYGQEVLKVGGKGRKERKGERRDASFSSDDGDSDSSSTYEWDYVDQDLAGELQELQEEVRTANPLFSSSSRLSADLPHFIPSSDSSPYEEDIEFYPDYARLSPLPRPLLRSVLANTTLPSWIDRLPPNLSTDGKDTLKADGWHRLLTSSSLSPSFNTGGTVKMDS